MGFVLVVVVVVVAGWLYMASRANTGVASRNTRDGSDDYVPVNAYDNPYDTNEANDRPFESDSCSDTSDDSSSASDSDSCSDSSDSSSD